MIKNITFDELTIGQKAQITKTITDREIMMFALLTEDVNPMHLNEDYAHTTRFKHLIAHGMLVGSLISAILGTKLPGPGTIYLKQSFKFVRPVFINDTITAEITIVDKNPENKHVILECRCFNQKNEDVITGQTEVIAPTEKVCIQKTFSL